LNGNSTQSLAFYVVPLFLFELSMMSMCVVIWVELGAPCTFHLYLPAYLPYDGNYTKNHFSKTRRVFRACFFLFSLSWQSGSAPGGKIDSMRIKEKIFQVLHFNVLYVGPQSILF